MNHILTATEIDTWSRANPRRAQELLPELIARLVLCTSSKIRDYNFPVEKGIQFAGYDGVLDSGESTSYFPEGKSVWEFGTNEDALGKFKSDVEKRHRDSLGVVINETTFIFATLKIWNHRTSIEEVVNESKNKYAWKGIRIIDGSKISLWLQPYPAVAVWLANAMGKHVDGIRTIEDFWNDYCESTSPKLNTDYFLLGRDVQTNRLSKWLERKFGSLTLISESTLESVLFIAAYFLANHEKNEALINETLIVESIEKWNELIEGKADCLLLPVFNFTENIRCPAEMFIILPIAKYSPLSKIVKNTDSIKIEKRSKVMYRKALESLGYGIADFQKIETETKRSFLPLHRKITASITRKEPRWLSEQGFLNLIPAFLVGGWNGDLEGDREAIAAISGLSYEDYICRVNEWLTIEDAPIFKVFNTYQMVSVQDMWTFLYESLTEDQIKRFRECVLAVFGEEDPTFQLPEDQWAFASVCSKRSKYSGLLREGLTISLILFSEQGDRENNFNIISAESYVYCLVQDVLNLINTCEEWNTIAPSLTALAEASPAAVLEKLEQEISNSESEIWRLFKPAKDILMGRSYYTNILWALEQLVWYRSYVVQAIDLLVAINEKQLEYTLTNSPISTLYEIFCTWYPQSCLNCEERIELLKKICKTHPTTGKALISMLIPTGHATCGCIQKPRWHSFDTEFQEGVTYAEHDITLRAIANIAVSVADTASQWCTIVSCASFFAQSGEPWLEKLSKYCIHAPDAEKQKIADSLRSEISRNRKFCNADWAMSEIFLQQMETLLSQILPSGIGQYMYLFMHCPKLLHPIPHDKGHFDYKKEQDHLRSIRMNAIHNILSNYGSDSLIDFSLHAESTEELAEVIVSEVFHNAYDFPSILRIKANTSLYTSVLYRLYQINGLEAFLLAIEEAHLTGEDKADMICKGPLDPEIWIKLEDLNEEIVRYYWEHVNTLGFLGRNDEHIDYFLSQLLKYDRPYSVAQVIAFSDYSNSEMIMRTLSKCCEMQNCTEPTGASLQKLAEHDVLDLFDKLYSNQNIELDKLVQLEISFLPYFRFHSFPKGIEKFLLENPIEYVNLITANYKSNPGADPLNQNFSGEQCRTAYEIVDSFRTIPGCDGTTISEEEFSRWVVSAQEYAEQIGYTNSFIHCFGRVLSYAPVGSDGIFPHEVVRGFLEQTQNEKLVSGFIIGKRNQRGVHTVTGGLEEKEIAQRYQEAASSIRISYPRTASILEKLSECYKEESLYEQKRELLDFYG